VKVVCLWNFAFNPRLATGSLNHALDFNLLLSSCCHKEVSMEIKMSEKRD
jgi:hypothetical protein